MLPQTRNKKVQQLIYESAHKVHPKEPTRSRTTHQFKKPKAVYKFGGGKLIETLSDMYCYSRSCVYYPELLLSAYVHTY